ncbi:hypothetical protein SAMN05518800_1808 [Variovorax sp. YR752]|jgi:hypothetical protein|uniref:hypothetical protein n=1 Tax=Variovorax sp. YR752 TaxID=1884383 RepID=UPI000BCE76C5|nr:hypothetical protein [Variovorax sp. YR752]SOD25237.1 hypothetical protein SAMN05518800_1808 [Variovorax sp. YR752]
MLTFLGWAFLAFALFLFVVCIVGFVNPQWLADKKTGNVPSRGLLLLAAWLGPVIPAAAGGTILILQRVP